MAKPPTVTDIAQLAGVSPSTVSRVLSGKNWVHPEKSAAVHAAIEQLNFRPNLAARALAQGKSMAIGILTQSLASQFYGEITQGIEEGLSGSGYQPILVSGHWHHADEQAALDILLARQVDGIILLGGEHPAEGLLAINTHTPLIIVGRTIPELSQQCIKVTNREGAFQAVRHLIDLGHRRIAHITCAPAHDDIRERRLGYTEALASAGIALDERLIVEGSYTEQSGLIALESLIARGGHFTAIFAANDQMAYGARLGLYRHSLRVPDDVSLVGFDDLLDSAYATPPITSVRQHMLEQGRRAARGMLSLLAGLTPELAPVITELIVRESSARLRG